MECKDCHGRQEPPSTRLVPGQRTVPFGSFCWRVLDVQDGRALLLAEEILEERRYHSERTSVTWETCELRGYLNGEFLESFSGQEQSRMMQIEHTTADNPWYGISGGGSTVDRVFLLSIEEVMKYFGDSGDLQARKSWDWDWEKEEWIQNGKGWTINDQYNHKRMAEYRGEAEWWWLRSPGVSGSGAAGVDNGGRLCMGGSDVFLGEGGVRPALWLKL